MIGSILIYMCTDNDAPISVRHPVIQGSSGWFLGRRVSHLCHIKRIDENALALRNGAEFSLIDFKHHGYVHLSTFLNQDCQSPSLSCLSAVLSAMEFGKLDNQAKLSRVVHRVHRYTCCHASYSNTHTLLSRNRLWSDHAQQYLAAIVAECRDCKTASSPPHNRCFSISSLDQFFNETVLF